MKKALITGISGQDGAYLSGHLLSLGYEVYGIIRRHSLSESQDKRIAHLSDRITTFYGDVTDAGSVEKVMSLVMPDEIYNLAAQSHVRVSNDIPTFTSNVNAIGALNVLEAFRKIVPKAKFYQASSSEMFGGCVDDDMFQRESTPMHPVSPYGVSKLFAYSMVRHYRKAYNLFACNGILFNHESPLRGEIFVTQKIVKAAVRIKLFLDDKLELGNLDSYRDWGHSKDYTKAMHLIMQHSIPEDFVVATGQTNSIRVLCYYVFNKLNLNYNNYVIQDEKHKRSEELPYLKGDSTKIRTELGWKPEYTFETLLDEMIEYWMEYYGSNRI